MGSRPSPAVIANRELSDFSEDGRNRSQYHTGHGVPFGSAISEEVVILPGLFGFQGTCTASGVKLLPGTAKKEYVLSHTMTFSAHLYSAFTET